MRMSEGLGPLLRAGVPDERGMGRPHPSALLIPDTQIRYSELFGSLSSLPLINSLLDEQARLVGSRQSQSSGGFA